MKIDEILNDFEVDCTKNLISEAQINDIETALGVKMGPALQEYVLKCGYLGFEYIEFYGIYSNMLMQSDMITQTQYLHKYFEKAKAYIAFENVGEGDYALVDSNDNVLMYTSETDELKDLKLNLYEYIRKRFSEV